MDRIVERFGEYLKSTTTLTPITIAKYQTTANEFIKFLIDTYKSAWLGYLTHQASHSDFETSLIQSGKNLEPETIKEKLRHIEVFQAYLNHTTSGRLEVYLTRIDNFQRRPTVRIIGIVIFLLVTLSGLIQLGQYIHTALFPTQTPVPPPTLTATVTATSTPTPTMTLTSTPTLTVTPTLPPPASPKIQRVIVGFDTAGYSKQTPFVRDSQGVLTLFIRDGTTGDLAYTRSNNEGATWSSPIIFDTIEPQPHVSATIDRADGIHLVWGVVPNAGDLNYGLLRGNTWERREVVAFGVFARDIAVDSANRPHIVWTTTDLQYRRFDGQQWLDPENVGSGLWHPDIQLDAEDNVYIFGNGANFFPMLGIPVGVFDDSKRVWEATILSDSDFWSGGAAAIIDPFGVIYVFWFGASSNEGGDNLVYFTRFINGAWQPPFVLDYVYATTGTTGQESPAVGVDANGVIYIVWRGENDRNRPVIYARCFIPGYSSLGSVSAGWLSRITFDDRSASNVGWPSIADARVEYLKSGVDIVWPITAGTEAAIDYVHFDCLS